MFEMSLRLAYWHIGVVPMPEIVRGERIYRIVHMQKINFEMMEIKIIDACLMKQIKKYSLSLGNWFAGGELSMIPIHFLQCKHRQVEMKPAKCDTYSISHRGCSNTLLV